MSDVANLLNAVNDLFIAAWQFAAVFCSSLYHLVTNVANLIFTVTIATFSFIIEAVSNVPQFVFRFWALVQPALVYFFSQACILLSYSWNFMGKLITWAWFQMCALAANLGVGIAQIWSWTIQAASFVASFVSAATVWVISTMVTVTGEISNITARLIAWTWLQVCAVAASLVLGLSQVWTWTAQAVSFVASLVSSSTVWILSSITSATSHVCNIKTITWVWYQTCELATSVGLALSQIWSWTIQAASFIASSVSSTTVWVVSSIVSVTSHVPGLIQGFLENIKVGVIFITGRFSVALSYIRSISLSTFEIIGVLWGYLWSFVLALALSAWNVLAIVCASGIDLISGIFNFLLPFLQLIWQLLSLQFVLTIILGGAIMYVLINKRMPWIQPLLQREQNSRGRQQTAEETRTHQNSTCNLENNTSDQQYSQCVVCWDKPKEVVLLPCRHLCLCIECSNRIRDRCPMCNLRFRNKMPVYT